MVITQKSLKNSLTGVMVYGRSIVRFVQVLAQKAVQTPTKKGSNLKPAFIAPSTCAQAEFQVKRVPNLRQLQYSPRDAYLGRTCFPPRFRSGLPLFHTPIIGCRYLQQPIYGHVLISGSGSRRKTTLRDNFHGMNEKLKYAS